MIATKPPTQREIATTCTTKDPIARACEPLDAEWLSKTGAMIAARLSKSSAFAPATPLMRATIVATSSARQSCANIYLPSVICEIKERIDVGSKAPDRSVPRIFANVATIEIPVAIAQASAANEVMFLKALALSPSFPSTSFKKKAMARSKPIVVMPAARDKNLLISSKFIAR